MSLMTGLHWGSVNVSAVLLVVMLTTVCTCLTLWVSALRTRRYREEVLRTTLERVLNDTEVARDISRLRVATERIMAADEQREG